MNYITKYELDNKELASKFSIENGNLVFDENSKFKEDFQVGDIIVSKNNTEILNKVYHKDWKCSIKKLQICKLFYHFSD